MRLSLWSLVVGPSLKRYRRKGDTGVRVTDTELQENGRGAMEDCHLLWRLMPGKVSTSA